MRLRPGACFPALQAAAAHLARAFSKAPEEMNQLFKKGKRERQPVQTGPGSLSLLTNHSGFFFSFFPLNLHGSG